ncbi:Holliday junction resolvase RuvX [Candidatus Erwinia haradaeae]|uniref:Putative pre-16S rRNA nuclease n=1 Tax=Candidatus Erwinia haradaeae TaxID=1922217 RepID=A0A451D7V6_9GAMM|nr:Holliday junction resolvase RuvX [Candidatus Erwinia haradaeae]VFP81886.1 Putative pre-16S rRNA nuclease [Candidatus Erwinia haradaeae]
MNHKTLLSFDFGMRRIGVASGQDVTKTACPLNVLNAKNGKPNWNEVDILLKEWQPNHIVIGLPLNMDGSDQAITTHTRKFSHSIYLRYNIPISLHDERLSTKEARSILFEYEGGYQAFRKRNIDSIAAVIILESWLEENSL